MIALRDKNIIVAYLQIYLKEYFPNAIIYHPDGTIETINNKPLKVTGVYDYTTYQVLACYMYATYPNEKFPKESIWTTDETGKPVFEGMQDFSGDKSLKEVIDENINITCMRGYYEAIEIPDRVLSYILREVVTVNSSMDEIFRIQKLIYGPSKVPISEAGVFTEPLVENVKNIQQMYLDTHTFKNDEGEEIIDVPSNYKDFKVTGYVDPWTEVLYEYE